MPRDETRVLDRSPVAHQCGGHAVVRTGPVRRGLRAPDLARLVILGACVATLIVIVVLLTTGPL